jgi:hypothetical protein
MNHDEEAAHLGLHRTGRTPIIGLDDRKPLHQTTGQSGIAALRAEASIHERNRLETVAEFYALMSVLAWAGILSGPNAASKGKTTYQFGKGTKESRTEAAHCLPAQVLINGRYPNSLLESAANVHQCGLKPLPVASKLRNLFGRTNITSVEVNDADGSIERISGGLGIKIAFVKWTDHLLDQLEKSPPQSKADVLKTAREAYTNFLDAEKIATRTRLSRRRGNSIIDKAKRAKNDLQILLLESFQHTQASQINPCPLSDTDFEIFWEEVAKQES